jgi:hypothetical protein
MPRLRAIATASATECSDEYGEGIATPVTCSGPSASAAMVTTTAESMPPDRPIRASSKPLWWQ